MTEMQNLKVSDTGEVIQKLIQGLKEALECKLCQPSPTFASMTGDIKRGHYITSHYPPFFRTNDPNDKGIAIGETTARLFHSWYWDMITHEMREQYYQHVEQALNRLLDETKDFDPEVALLFAHYQTDFHIRQHHFSGRGILNFCRDADDMQQLRHWQWRLHDIDHGKPIDQNNTWPYGCNHTAWPGDENSEMPHAALLWKANVTVRQKHLNKIRAEWAIIMNERRKYREMVLRKQKAKDTITVRLYCRGELKDIRQMKRLTPVEVAYLAEKALQSPVGI
ncbi:Uncharacterized protein PECH_008524 [Penicillium ucsense]|uniref:Uncharacterized protein n=1 Tax=Penicillium ucsense TaxID=2839758 RepID=A0A8J8W5J4_9EURO|nr:Uncharacterized protein PECM_006569 [Penicillium ucsense]KAF7734060.1 Uncharacterized protein PECH_008524 [Penicillium ucsense]